MNRHDVCGVSDRHGLESTPRELRTTGSEQGQKFTTIATYTEQQVTGEKHLNIDGKELNEEEPGQAHEGDEHGESISESLGQWTRNLKPEDVTDLYGAGQSGLPWRRDLERFRSFVPETVLFGERGLSPELTLK